MSDMNKRYLNLVRRLKKEELEKIKELHASSKDSLQHCDDEEDKRATQYMRIDNLTIKHSSTMQQIVFTFFLSFY